MLLTAQSFDKLVSQSFEPSSNAIGSGGTVTWRFEAKGTGQTELKLNHYRPFEEDVPPIQTFEVKVTVR